MSGPRFLMRMWVSSLTAAIVLAHEATRLAEEKASAESGSDVGSRRRGEEVDYWRKRAGWFDDDVSMQEYNEGVYDTYYQPEDADDTDVGEDSGGPSFLSTLNVKKIAMNVVKVLGVILSIGAVIFIIRAIRRRIASSSTTTTSTKSKNRSSSASRAGSRSGSRGGSRRRSDSRSRRSSSRARSKSVGRSSSGRSRSRSRRQIEDGGNDAGTGNYELMDEKSMSKSTKSNRSGRSRSRSVKRSSREASRSRSKRESGRDEMLV